MTSSASSQLRSARGGWSQARAWPRPGTSSASVPRHSSLGRVFALVNNTFFGALAIGLLASQPVEQARRRQLEFTADDCTSSAPLLRS